MYSYKTEIRVRYNETDRMGYLHHGNYPAYFEIARTEMMRSLGISYKELEDSGIIMPVYDMQINFKIPAHYDDKLSIVTEIEILPVIKLITNNKVINEKGQMICNACVTLAFVSIKTRKPVRAPEDFLARFSQFFS